MSKEESKNFNDRCKSCLSYDDCDRRHFELRAECLEYIENLKNNSESVTEELAKELIENEKKYAFERAKPVLISKKHPDYKLFNWVIQAADSDDKREMFSCAYCGEFSTTHRLYCSDGKRLHVIDNVWSYGFEVGVMYTIVKSSKRIAFIPKLIEGNYPKYENVLELALGGKEISFESGGATPVNYVARLARRLCYEKFPSVIGDYLAPFACFKYSIYSQNGDYPGLVVKGEFNESQYLAVISPFKDEFEKKSK